MSQRVKPVEPPPSPVKESNAESPVEVGVGWWIAVVLWGLAFGGLVLSEVWNVLWRGVRALF